MNPPARPKGPWTHRLLIYVFSGLLTLLTFWLLGFVLRDISTLPGPDPRDFAARFLDQSQLDRVEQLDQQLATVRREIQNQRERQAILRDSTSSSERTMNQLLEMKRLSIEKGLPLSESEENALQQSKDLFLANQDKYQTLNEDIARLSEDERSLLRDKNEIEQSLAAQREQMNDAFATAQQRHQWKLAALKLVFLLPLLALAVWLFLRFRASAYAPLIYAPGIALAIQVLMVMHQHFPTRYFKYILLAASIVVVARILLYLLGMIVRPRKDWLLKQYREAYEKFLCPVCSYPIRRGPMKFLYWTGRTIKRISGSLPKSDEGDAPYTCPSCGTTLFEKCASCGHTRPALLPACDKCGAEKPLEFPTPA